MMLDAECRTEMEIAMLANEDFRGDTAWGTQRHWTGNCSWLQAVEGGFTFKAKCNDMQSFYTPKKLTWNLEIMVSNRNLLFQGTMFRFHVCFGGCIYYVTHFQVFFFKSTTFYIILLYLTTHFESF